MEIRIPYGRGYLTAEIADNRINATLCSRLESYIPPMGQRELVEEALKNPIGSETLESLAAGKENIVLIASDHTRPVPSKVLVPPMLDAIRATGITHFREGGLIPELDNPVAYPDLR